MGVKTASQKLGESSGLAGGAIRSSAEQVNTFLLRGIFFHKNDAVSRRWGRCQKSATIPLVTFLSFFFLEFLNERAKHFLERYRSINQPIE